MDELTFSQAAPAAVSPEQVPDASVTVRLRRFAAAIVDAAITLVVAFLLLAIFVKKAAFTVDDDDHGGTLAGLLLLAYYLVAAGRAAYAAGGGRTHSGQTFGRWVLGIRMEEVAGGQPSRGRAVLHAMVPAFIVTNPLLLACLNEPLGRSETINGAIALSSILFACTVLATALASAEGLTFYDRLLGVRTVRRYRGPRTIVIGF